MFQICRYSEHQGPSTEDLYARHFDEHLTRGSCSEILQVEVPSSVKDGACVEHDCCPSSDVEKWWHSMTDRESNSRVNMTQKERSMSPIICLHDLITTSMAHFARKDKSLKTPSLLKQVSAQWTIATPTQIAPYLAIGLIQWYFAGRHPAPPLH